MIILFKQTVKQITHGIGFHKILVYTEAWLPCPGQAFQSMITKEFLPFAFYLPPKRLDAVWQI